VAPQHKLHRQTPPILGLLDIGTAKTVCFIVAAARRGREGPVDVLGIGQKVQVEISEIDQRGKLSLVPVMAEEAPSEGGADDAAKTAEPADATA